MRLALVMLLALAPACHAADAADPCGAVPLAEMVGKPLDAGRLPPGARVIRPGYAVTQDWNAGRLNVELDDKGVVTRLRCG